MEETDSEPCPEKPYESCTGDSAVVDGRDEDGKQVHVTSWEGCQRFSAWASTIYLDEDTGDQ